MARSEPQFWPFPVPPAESLSQEHREHIRFLEEAYAAGYCPRESPGPEFELEYAGRYVLMIARGRGVVGGTRRWEILLSDESRRYAAFWVSRFECGTKAAFAWLAGEDAPAALAMAGDTVIRGGLDTPPLEAAAL